MLTTISITNFTIVEQLDLSFDDGLTVLTGETGAGKSIIIDALQYVLGARTDTGIIRHGKKRTIIKACFNLQTIPAAQQWLTKHQWQHQQQCQLQREISDNGRSKQSVNGHKLSQAQMRELASLLINIHGQHENQSLLNNQSQIQFIDDFSRSYDHEQADHQQCLESVSHLYHNWCDLDKEIQQLSNTKKDDSRLALLHYQLQELNALNLLPNEFEELSEEHKQLSNSDEQIANCQQALNLIYHADNHNAFGLLTTAEATLGSQKNQHKAIEAAYHLINDAMIHTQEAANSLRDYIENIEANPQRLQEIDQRLGEIHNIARKHHVAPEQLSSVQEQIADQIDKIEHREQRLKILHQECQQIEKAYYQAAKLLSDSRHNASESLNEIVTKYIQRLGMPDSEFKVEITKQQIMTVKGIDRINFLVKTNPGQPFKPLHKIASGGELSRISLAIQVITTQADDMPSLIFDEVDVGIGGRVAEIIGTFLNDLSQRTQVICITHLPQVAAQGKHHFLVNKTTHDNNTSVSITPLSIEQRITEIARMLGGIHITEQTLAHAREMLQSDETA